MISIKDTVGSIWVPCPKCGISGCITDWGEQTCIYEKCDGHKFVVEFNLEMATLMLKKIQEETQRRKTEKIKRPSIGKLQKINGGWISVPQPDTTDRSEWYKDDPFLKL